MKEHSVIFDKDDIGEAYRAAYEKSLIGTISLMEKTWPDLSAEFQDNIDESNDNF